MIALPFQAGKEILIVGVFFKARDGDGIVAEESYQFGDDSDAVVAAEK